MKPSEPASTRGAPDVHARRSKNRRSVFQRWQAAVNELVVMQSECDERLQNLPESLQESATAEALQAICDLNLDELQAIEPPRGFGRD
jgi:hypothetical protein